MSEAVGQRVMIEDVVCETVVDVEETPTVTTGGDDKSESMTEEEKEEQKLREEEERKEKQREEERLRLEKPWLFETEFPMTQPPDINFRRLIEYDQEQIDRLLERETLHFTERCLRYKEHDVWIEISRLFFIFESEGSGILCEYLQWVEYMLKSAKGNDVSARERFFQELHDVLEEDYSEVSHVWSALWSEQKARERQQAAQELGIPVDPAHWNTEHKRKYHDYGQWVQDWPNPVTILESTDDRQEAYSAETSLNDYEPEIEDDATESSTQTSKDNGITLAAASNAAEGNASPDAQDTHLHKQNDDAYTDTSAIEPTTSSISTQPHPSQSEPPIIAKISSNPSTPTPEAPHQDIPNPSFEPSAITQPTVTPTSPPVATDDIPKPNSEQPTSEEPATNQTITTTAPTSSTTWRVAQDKGAFYFRSLSLSLLVLLLNEILREKLRF